MQDDLWIVPTKSCYTVILALSEQNPFNFHSGQVLNHTIKEWEYVADI